MHLSKNSVTVIIVFLFLSSSALLMSGLFIIPPGAGNEYFMDKVFYYSSFIIFWLSAPYLLSKLIRRILWKGEFADSVSAGAIGRLEDLIVTSLYFFSIGLIVIKIFDFRFTFYALLVIAVLLGLTVYIRPRLLKFTKSGFIQTARPFKTGDWISLSNPNGNRAFTGKILSFDSNSVRLKSAEDTLLVIPNSQMNNFVVENYNALNAGILLNLNYRLSADISPERGKKIFGAAVKDALLSYPNAAHSPEIYIAGISEEAIEYKIVFNFCPWITASPDSVKDKILGKVRNHLYYAGIGFGSLEKNCNILNDVDIFKSLSEKEIETLFNSSVRTAYKAGDVIIKEGESGSSMYILAEGLLNVFVNESGKERVKVGAISPGEFFGEMSLFTGEARTATVIAETDSVTVEICKEPLNVVLKKRPELANAFGAVIAERQSINLKKMDDYLKRKETFTAKIAAGIRSFFNLKS